MPAPASNGRVGLTSQPEAERVRGHAGKAGEESPRTLGACASKRKRANVRTSAPAGSTLPSHRRRRDKTATDDPAGAGISAEPPVDPKLIITRATSKLRIWFKAMPDAERKALYEVLNRTRSDFLFVINALMRRYWLEDGLAMDAYKASHGGEAPKRGSWKTEWPMAKLPGYTIARSVAPKLAAGIASAAQQIAMKKWAKTRFDSVVRGMRPSFFGWKDPFSIRAQEVRGRFEYDPKQKMFRFSPTFGAEGADRFRIPFRVRDGYQRMVLSKIASGEWLVGDCQFKQDSIRPSRWYLTLSYKKPRMPTSPDAPRYAAINRGLRNFVVIVGEDGEWLPHTGSRLIAYRKQLKRRRQEYQRDSRLSGRKGRGRKKILRPIAPLIEKGERWSQTQCQTYGRQIAKWVADGGYTDLIIEDFTAIRQGLPERLKKGKKVWDMVQEWPYFKLQSAIVASCEEYGVRVWQVPPELISQKCPACGYTDQSNRDLRRWLLDCKECSFTANLDRAAAMNVLARGKELLGRSSKDVVLLGPKDPKPKRGSRKRPPELAESKGPDEAP